LAFTPPGKCRPGASGIPGGQSACDGCECGALLSATGMFPTPTPDVAERLGGRRFRSNPCGCHPSLLFRHVCGRQCPFFRRRLASDHRLNCGRRRGLRCLDAPDDDSLIRQIGVRALAVDSDRQARRAEFPPSRSLASLRLLDSTVALRPVARVRLSCRASFRGNGTLLLASQPAVCEYAEYRHDSQDDQNQRRAR